VHVCVSFGGLPLFEPAWIAYTECVARVIATIRQ